MCKAELRALEERGSLLERVQLDVRVRLAEGLRVQNRQVEVVADGAVTLGGDLLTPEVRGSVSLRDGGLTTFKMTTSPSPTTINCTPAVRPSRFLTSSGITTCPFEERRVVARASMRVLQQSYW